MIIITIINELQIHDYNKTVIAKTMETNNSMCIQICEWNVPRGKKKKKNSPQICG